jgi:hypothetical protein
MMIVVLDFKDDSTRRFKLWIYGSIHGNFTISGWFHSGKKVFSGYFQVLASSVNSGFMRLSSKEPSERELSQDEIAEKQQVDQTISRG